MDFDEKKEVLADVLYAMIDDDYYDFLEFLDPDPDAEEAPENWAAKVDYLGDVLLWIGVDEDSVAFVTEGLLERYGMQDDDGGDEDD